MANLTPYCLRSTLAFAALALIPSVSYGQLDRVYPVDGKGVTGTVMNVVRDGIQLKVGDTPRLFRIDQIDRVTFEGDPGPLTRGRELALEGQYQSALEQLETIDFGNLRREYVAADAAYFLASSQAHLALAGQREKNEAIRNLRAFVQKFPQSMHYFGANELLGDLALTLGEYEQAEKFYAELASSRTPSVQTKAVYLSGIAMLRQGNADQALPEFQKAAGANLESTEGARLKMLARAGEAVALSLTGKGDEALTKANALIDELNPEDAELAARIYNARGAANVAKGDTEAALLDYLHTHLLFSNIADAHAEALSEMVKLWPKVGKPDQAARARQELQSRYPGWGG